VLTNQFFLGPPSTVSNSPSSSLPSSLEKSGYLALIEEETKLAGSNVRAVRKG